MGSVGQTVDSSVDGFGKGCHEEPPGSGLPRVRGSQRDPGAQAMVTAACSTAKPIAECRERPVSLGAVIRSLGDQIVCVCVHACV